MDGRLCITISSSFPLGVVRRSDVERGERMRRAAQPAVLPAINPESTSLNAVRAQSVSGR